MVGFWDQGHADLESREMEKKKSREMETFQTFCLFEMNTYQRNCLIYSLKVRCNLSIKLIRSYLLSGDKSLTVFSI